MPSHKTHCAFHPQGTVIRRGTPEANQLPRAERTPAEDAAARAKEAEEQAALPYKWSQTIADVDISFSVPGNMKGKDLVVEIKKNALKAGIKGQEPIIQV